MKPSVHKSAAGRTPAQLRAARVYETGLSCAAREDRPAALAAFREATTLNPAMSAAWYRLGEALWRAGDAAGADAALMRYVLAARDDTELQQLVQTVASGRLDVAERKLRARLRGAPADVAAMRVLAQALIGQKKHDEADAELERALALAPSFAQARGDLANAFARRNMAVQAMPHVQWLLEQEPGDYDRRAQLAWCLEKIGDFEAALLAYEEALKVAPRVAKIWMHYGNALKNAGRRDEGEAAYRRCIAMAPGDGGAWRGLSNLNAKAFSAADIAAMRAELARPGTAADDRIDLDYALGRVLEQAGDYAGSFAHYASGAKGHRARLTYDADAASAQVAAAKALYTPAFFAARAGVGYDEVAPIFILGMPRSGSTLIEQILASHSNVEATSELSIVTRMAVALGGGPGDAGKAGYLKSVATLEPEAFAALGRTYVDRTRIYRQTERPVFTDKQPVNWEFIGFIRLMLPRAKIVDARRHPVASCFSAFKHFFPYGLHFTYDLKELARYYRDYMDLMEHFDAVLPGYVHRVMYEDMVADTEGAVRRLLDYCELPFEASCLRFWETQRAVSTASSQQVRQPIYTEGLDLWRRYEPWLGELRAALDEGK
jgi:tetratricopeptide (TPR) repeat protein